jgi:hypothetical protein
VADAYSCACNHIKANDIPIEYTKLGTNTGETMNSFRKIGLLLVKALSSQDEKEIRLCLNALQGYYDIIPSNDMKVEVYLDKAYDKVESHLNTVEENNGNFGFNDGE